ncbi:hypothetical protein BN946_scf184994.g39 [Trametes cinnabarina]|uniref:Glycoside Hydrolase Family 79 protein n=1 Tax=Pycnoporus cinnabarinus TaxID=5643 RepID=A0A060SF24_PYCCI|nr:hypothetical protein BN946_scf184994.g39 [Trametes cinnabarina]
MLPLVIAFAVLSWLRLGPAHAITVPTSPPSDAAAIDPSLVSVSIEFFAFPGYMQLRGTSKCLANLASLRGAQPAIRIGGTTQYVEHHLSCRHGDSVRANSHYHTLGSLRIRGRDRATYDANLQAPVNYTVASPADAPTSLTYGPPFFTLAAQFDGEVTLGLNRQLNNQANSLAAGLRAKESMMNLFAIELGNEPDLYASGSPIAAGAAWSQSADISSEAKWFTEMAPSVSASGSRLTTCD